VTRRIAVARNILYPHQLIVRELAIGILASVVASVLVYVLGKMFAAGNVLLLLLTIVVFVSGGLLVLLYLRVKALAAPGFVGWIRNRENGEYIYEVLRDVERSFEVMSCTGSSVFVQGGKLLNILQEKYQSSANFETKILLVDPKASNLISYRKRRLGNEPNVLGEADILSAIRVLKQARDSFVREPKQSLDIRTYSNELVWHIMLIDRHLALLGFYGPGKSGWKWPVLIFEKKEGSFYYAIEEQFDQRWAASKKYIL